MSKPIRVVESTVRPIKVVESAIGRIDPAKVAAAGPSGKHPTEPRARHGQAGWRGEWRTAGPGTRQEARGEGCQSDLTFRIRRPTRPSPSPQTGCSGPPAPPGPPPGPGVRRTSTPAR